MGFMVMECGLGLYTLALLHLIGHSLYKAHAFLSASGVVEDTRVRLMRGSVTPSMASMLAAPLLSAAVIAGVFAAVATVLPTPAWPWWWSGVLAFAWAPLLWLPAARQAEAPGALRSLVIGGLMVAGLVLAALVGHALPFGVTDAPQAAAGLIALAGMAFLYLSLLRMQSGAPGLASWRRWSYAGFYVDEFVTRAALKLWPARWTAAH
jgi:NAD(P)H-quinone oxidoreductase subunit 5